MVFQKNKDSKKTARGERLLPSIGGTKMKRSKSFPLTTNDTKQARFCQWKANMCTRQINLEVCEARLNIRQELLKDNEDVFGGKD